MSTEGIAEVQVGPGTLAEPQVQRLLVLSEEYSRSLYPPGSVHVLPIAELSKPNVYLRVARDGVTVLGCAALVVQDSESAEIKRMFVDPAVRRRGLGALLLGNLESIARERRVCTLLLETGVSQPEAIALYRKAGFFERGPFGTYQEDPLSVFMEKRLEPWLMCEPALPTLASKERRYLG